MKRLSITYHMSVERSKPWDQYPHCIETAENCITIPMIDEIADDILKNQRNSQYVTQTEEINLTDILNGFAKLQGYTEAVFVNAKEVCVEG